MMAQEISISTIHDDIAGCITQFLTLGNFVKLLMTNKKAANLFGPYIHKLSWSVRKVVQLEQNNKELFEYINLAPDLQEEDIYQHTQLVIIIIIFIAR